MSLLDNSGNLEELALPDLLASICGPQETGVLRLTRHGVTKAIYIQEGRIVFATSTDPDDRLGELLLRKGLLRVQHFEDASAQLTQRKRLGALLVEMGHLKPEELVRAVVEQVKDIVFDLFLWVDGEYHFMKGELPSREVITLKLSTPEVILGGIQRIHRWSRVLRGVGGLDSLFQASRGRQRTLQQMQLRAEHAAILQYLDHPMSVRDLCRRGLLGDFEVCRALWAFRVIGLVESASAARQEPEALDAGLFLEEVNPAANAMTVAMPAVGRQPARAPARTAPASLGAGQEAEGAEPGLEIVEMDEPAAPARGPAALHEGEVEAALESFNERHRRLHGLLLEKAGARAADLVQRSLAMMEQDLPGLFNGLAPGPDGSFDLEALKMNIFAFGVLGYAAGLDMLIDREVEATGILLGPEVRRQIASALKTTPV